MSKQQNNTLNIQKQQVPETIKANQPVERAHSKLSNRSIQSAAKQEEKLVWETLCTGLQQLIPEDQVLKAWQSDKPKSVITAYLQDFFQRVKIQEKFEAMEMNIITEFHLFNLIFAKEELGLDDRKTQIFLNLMWTLLINNNDDYKTIAQKVDEVQSKSSSNVLKTHESDTDKLFPPPPDQKKTNQKSYSQRKTIASDYESLRFWIRAHTKHDPPNSLEIFNQLQLIKIIKYAQESYFNNHKLYKLCLNDKNSNDEINFIIYVDEPIYVPPLSEALYLGKIQQINFQVSLIWNQMMKMRSSRKIYLKFLNKLNRKSQLRLASIKKVWTNKIKYPYIFIQKEVVEEQQSGVEDPKVKEFKEMVEKKLQNAKLQFANNLKDHENLINDQFDELVNPNKKKK